MYMHVYTMYACIHNVCIYYIKQSVCLCVCLFLMHGRISEPIWLKFSQDIPEVQADVTVGFRKLFDRGRPRSRLRPLEVVVPSSGRRRPTIKKCHK